MNTSTVPGAVPKPFYPRSSYRARHVPTATMCALGIETLIEIFKKNKHHKPGLPRLQFPLEIRVCLETPLSVRIPPAPPAGERRCCLAASCPSIQALGGQREGGHAQDKESKGPRAGEDPEPHWEPSRGPPAGPGAGTGIWGRGPWRGGAGPRAGAWLVCRGGASLQAQTWRCGRALHLQLSDYLPAGSDAPPAASAGSAAASGGTLGRYHHLPARLEPSAWPGPSPGGGECVGGPQPRNHRPVQVPGLSRLPSPHWVGTIPLTSQPPDALAPTVEARDTRSCSLEIRTPPQLPTIWWVPDTRTLSPSPSLGL